MEEKLQQWQKLHELSNFKVGDVEEWQEEYIAVAYALTKEDKLEPALIMFFASETNYDHDKFDEFLDKLIRPSRFAEYLWLKFYDEEDQWKMFKAIVSTCLER